MLPIPLSLLPPMADLIVVGAGKSKNRRSILPLLISVT